MHIMITLMDKMDIFDMVGNVSKVMNKMDKDMIDLLNSSSCLLFMNMMEVTDMSQVMNPTSGGSSQEDSTLETFVKQLSCATILRLYHRFVHHHQIAKECFSYRYKADFLFFQYSLTDLLHLADNKSGNCEMPPSEAKP